MSGSQDGKGDRARRQQAMLLQAGEGGLWNPTDLQFMVDQGLSVPTGARFRAPTSAKELASWGFAGGGAGPDPMTGLDDWLGKNNMSLQDFQTQFGGLPLVFNADGTATFDPSAQRQSFSYSNPDDGLFHKLAPLALGGIATAGLGGFLPGTESIFGGAAGAAGSSGLGGASLGAEELFAGLNSLVPGGSGVAEAIAAGAGGAGANMGGSLAADEFLNSMSNFVPGGSGAAEAAAAATGASSGLGGSLAGDEFLNTMSEFVPGGKGAAEAAAAVGAASGAGAATGASSALSSLLKQAGIDVSPGMLDLIGKGLGLGLGAYGASQQADASKDLFNQYMGLGAPYRAELANLNANPSSFYNSDIFKGALQQGSDALSRSLSAKVGNPILNPTALQEMQNYTTRGSLDAYNNRWNQLSSAGQLGVGQASSLGALANQSTGNTYNAIGAGLQSVFGNQRDYTGEMLDILKQRNAGGSGNTYNLPGWGP